MKTNDIAKAAADSRLFTLWGKPIAARDIKFMISQTRYPEGLKQFLEFRMKHKLKFNFEEDYDWNHTPAPKWIRRKFTPQVA